MLRMLACLAVAVGLVVFCPEDGRAQTGREEVVSVEFSGNTAFTSEELSRAILSQASACPLLLRITTCLVGLDYGRDRFFFSPRGVASDQQRLQELYRAHGYWLVQVDTVFARSDDGTVDILFAITEGIPRVVDSIVLRGDSIPPGTLDDLELPLVPGGPLSLLLMNERRDLLTQRLRNSGYARAEVFKSYRRPRDSNEAVVTYTVQLGPKSFYGPLSISGNVLLDEESVRRRIPFREGQVYREEQIVEAQRSLYALDIIARALVVASPLNEGPDSIVPVRVEILEGDAHRVQTGGGVNTADCVNIEGRWTSRNFYGGGRTLQARGRVSNLLASTLHATPLCADAGTGEFGRTNWLAGIDFSQPTIFSPKNSFRAGLFGERRSLKNIFVRDAFGLDLGLTRDLGRNSFLNVRFQPQINRLDAAEVILCATFLACTPADISVLQSSNWLSPVAVSFNQDRSDGVFNPRSGFRALIDLEVADELTGSDYAYVRGVADGSLYHSVNRRTVLAMRLRVGRIYPGGFSGFSEFGRTLTSEIVPPQKRFYGGGASATRGFEQSTLGPRSLSVPVTEVLRRPKAGEAPACAPSEVATLACDASPLLARNPFQVRPVGGLGTLEASVEMRFDISRGLFGGVVFLDVGEVGPTGLPALRDLELTPGVGVRYTTPFGPIRLDVAYSFRNKEPLQVVTSQVRAFVVGADDDGDRINIAPLGSSGEERINWVISNDLALMDPRVMFGDASGFSFRRFAIHFSIGQAF